MKKLAAVLVGMSVSSFAFADGAKIQVHCFEELLTPISHHVEKKYELYNGFMPLGKLRIASKANTAHKKEYFLDFSANGKMGPNLEMIMPEPAQAVPAPTQQQEQGKDSKQCELPPAQEIIPGECIEIPNTTPAQEQGQCSQEQGKPAQDQGQCSQEQGKPAQATPAQGQCSQDQGKPAQDQGQCGQDQSMPAQVMDQASLKLFVMKSGVHGYHEAPASLMKGDSATLKITHHYGLSPVRTTCEVQYLGE